MKELDSPDVFKNKVVPAFLDIIHNAKTPDDAGDEFLEFMKREFPFYELDETKRFCLLWMIHQNAVIAYAIFHAAMDAAKLKHEGHGDADK